MPEIFGAALMGGGSGPAFAAIGVTYPAGATCTCALGDKTFTAPDTSGQALFIVPTAGEWVVTISQDGQEPKSQTVNVIESKAYLVTISFKFYIFNNGLANTQITGGLSHNKTSSDFGGEVTVLISDMIDMSCNSDTSYSTIIFTANKIDITNYETMYCSANVLKNFGAQYFGVIQETSNVTYLDFAARAEIAEGEVALDVSDLSGEYYLALMALNPGSAPKQSEIEISEVSLS